MSTGEMASDVTMLAEIRPAHDPMATNIYLSGKKKICWLERLCTSVPEVLHCPARHSWL